nr:immunoglobulin light chain junction region [Macaca mulatta]MPN90860.1 immunoglobulin light chain junction region [Macaca mulatta]MPN91464.1 immunoglobulin light chain junction region [Macaca mulatta]MPN92107.1 immunoglobulin light chain junction region [Macaca mulatta]MPN92176.1 immunoglobulin light chain junction region [Macaca mulatta]
CQKYGSSPYSF